MGLDNQRKSKSKQTCNNTQNFSQLHPLYFDSNLYGGKTNYANFNLDMFEALCKIELSGLEFKILFHICFEYTKQGSKDIKPIEKSHNDFANDFCCSPVGVKKAIRKLLMLNLIVQQNNGGRVKNSYIPNIDKLRELTIQEIKRKYG